MLAQTYRMLTNGLPPWYGEVAISAWKGVLFDSSTFLAFAMIGTILFIPISFVFIKISLKYFSISNKGKND